MEKILVDSNEVGLLDYQEEDLLASDEEDGEEESMETQEDPVVKAPTSPVIGVVESTVRKPSQQIPIAPTSPVTNDVEKSVERKPSQQTPVALTSPKIDDVERSLERKPSLQTPTDSTSMMKNEAVPENKVCVLGRNNSSSDSTPSCDRVQRFMGEEERAQRVALAMSLEAKEIELAAVIAAGPPAPFAPPARLQAQKAVQLTTAAAEKNAAQVGRIEAAIRCPPTFPPSESPTSRHTPPARNS